MKLSTITLLLCLFAPLYAQQAGHKMEMSKEDKPATLVAGMGSLHHPVSTKNAEAQKFFNQGLSYIYGFNHDEAIRSFQRALELDANLAMAHWGIALALGPNINLDVDPEREKA